MFFCIPGVTFYMYSKNVQVYLKKRTYVLWTQICVVNTQICVSCLVMGAIYITGPVLIKSDDNPTFLAVYRVDEKIKWAFADERCKDLLTEDASLLDPSDQEMFNVSTL